MRNQLNVIHAIDKYLRGVLNESETQEFENRLKTDTQLQQEVAKQELLMEAIKRSALKASAVKGKKKYKTIKTLKYVGVLVAAAAITAASFYFVNQNNTESETESNTELGIEALPTQGYELNTAQDTVIETENGSVFAIPADAFETESGESVTGKVNFEIKEAFEDLDIMKAGLTTTSNGELLETGGMFFLDATQNGQKLRLKKGKEILSQLPNLHPDKDMKLFDGETQPDGTINWVNPKEFEKHLITVDITSLDFYPEGYVEELSQTKKKILVRSEGDMPTKRMDIDTNLINKDFPAPPLPPLVKMDENEAIKKGLIIREYKDVVTDSKVYSKEFTDSLYYSFARLFEKKKPKIERVDDKDAQRITKSTNRDKVISDSTTFSSTHLPNSDIMKLWFNDGTHIKMSEIYYFNNWEKVQDSLFAIYGCKLNILKQRCEEKPETNDDVEGLACKIPSGINPAKVKAIWNEKFNNTILATKEFEERMKVIHESHQDWILEMYINNLDKPLWYSDSIASKMNESTTKKFRAFYKQRKGGVKVNDRLANKLTDYFTKKHKEFTSATSKAHQDYEKQKQQLRIEFQGKKSKKVQEEYNRKAKVYEEEYKINLCNAATQIGKKGYCGEPRPIARGRITARIPTLGAKNIDQYVAEATRNRESMVYTDPNSGKTVTLTYKPMKAKITNSEQFNKVYVYLIPDGLSSFNRMKTTDNVNFDFSLNMLFTYKLMAIGYKSKQPYFVELSSITAKEYSLSLTAISESELKAKLNKTKAKVKQEINSDKDFYQEEMVNNSREQQYLKDGNLMMRIGHFLFPEVSENCLEGGSVIDYNQFSNSGLFDPE